jgi:formate hydrogenlyase subunit 3/multisubunit Na+/H+ antiporter MnhD subunit
MISILNGIIILICVWKIDLDQGTYADVHQTTIPMPWAEIILSILGIVSIIYGASILVKQNKAKHN